MKIVKLLRILVNPKKLVRSLYHRYLVLSSRQKLKKPFVPQHKRFEIKKDYIEKVVVWGHKPFTHTHSFDQSYFYRSFKYLGFDTYWFDNKDDVSGFNFENTLFLTEGQVDQKIPLKRSSSYILHHCKLDKYIDNGCRYIQWGNYTHDCKLGNNFYYPGNAIEKIAYYAFLDAKNHILLQPSGTNLLPNEFPSGLSPFNPRAKSIYYIGSVGDDNRDMVMDFKKACRDHGKKFVLAQSVSDKKAQRLVCESFVNPDIRCQHHVNVGYLPGRVFKNISYGVIPATNSKFCSEFFGDVLPYSEDCYGLLEANEKFLRDPGNAVRSRELMREVQEHHTFVTRVQTILGVLDRV